MSIRFLQRIRNGGKMLIVCLYVDDLIYIGNDSAMIENFKQYMMLEFEMIDLGKMHYFLNIEVVQSTVGIFISQKEVCARNSRQVSNEELQFC